MFTICTVFTALCSDGVRTEASDEPHVAAISKTVKQYNIPLDQLVISPGSEELV
jgi:hypothetical protein